VLLDEVGVVPLPETSGVELAFRDAVVVAMMVVLKRVVGVGGRVLYDEIQGDRGWGDEGVQTPTSTSRDTTTAGNMVQIF